MEINLEKELFADGDKAFQKSLKKNMKVNHRLDKALESMTHPVANISAELSPEVGSIPTGHKKESYTEKFDRIYGAFKEALAENTEAKLRFKEMLEKNPEDKHKFDQALREIASSMDQAPKLALYKVIKRWMISNK